MRILVPRWMVDVAAPSSWHRRFEALVSVGPALLADAAVPSLVEGVQAGLVVAVVAPDVVGAASIAGAIDERCAPLLLASADGPDRFAVVGGAVAAAPVDVAPGALEGLQRARELVVDDLRSIGLPVVVAPPPPHGCAARIDVDAGDEPDDADHLRHVLAAAGLSGRVALAERMGHLARSACADVHVRFDGRTITLALLDTAAALRWVRRQLLDLGLGPSDVLVVTEGAADATVAHLVEGEPTPVVVGTADAGPATALLDQQVQLRARRALPRVVPSPGWRLVVSGFDPQLARARAVLFSLADGRVGIGGGVLAGDPRGAAWALHAGVYDGDGPETHLLPGPVATHLYDSPDPGAEAQRTLDLRTGVLHERIGSAAGPVDSVRFASLRRPGTVVVRAHAPVAPAGSPLQAPPGREVSSGDDDGVTWMAVAGTSGGISAAAAQSVAPVADAVVVDRVAAYVGDPEQLPGRGEAVARARAGASAGFDRLLAEHRAAWVDRWRDADVEIDGDDDLQLAVRFNLFHLMGSVADEGEAAVGARGLTGPAYRGHVFWDADTFVLPFLAATHPAAARAMLEYRIRRLDAARALARRLGRRGSRFPWESARTGEDVTPTSVRDRTGQVVPIRTGQLEEHIVGQVAWAACTYVDWTGDDAFAAGPGRQILVETARYWASRIRRTADGEAHLLGVIGPDEYHEPVDDNAFTNVLARWNLRRAVEVVASSGADGVSDEELATWQDLADRLVDGYRPSSGIYEQFAGFFGLEPLLISEVAPRRPIVADLLLGRERVQGAQVVKQADVLMLHHLLPDEVAAGSLEPNLRYYEPRTAHGSSLSPAVHASLLARVRDFDRALDSLRLAARIDLDDLTLTTAGGLHLATMGGVWQALVSGFAGVRPVGDRLVIDPRLPPAWHGLGVRVRFRGSRVRVRVEHDRLRVSADRPVAVEVDGAALRVDEAGVELVRRGPTWEAHP